METHFPGCSQRALKGTTLARVNAFTFTSERGTGLKTEVEERVWANYYGAAGFDPGFVWEVEWDGFREG